MNEPTMTPRSLVRTEEARETRNTPAEAGGVSAFARHKDPSLSGTGATAGAEEAKKKAAGVEWVRPTELLASRSGRIAGRGIDFQAELSRRARRVPGQTVRATRRGARTTATKVSERARRLPPASAFGRGADQRFSWVSRSGIGLG